MKLTERAAELVRERRANELWAKIEDADNKKDEYWAPLIEAHRADNHDEVSRILGLASDLERQIDEWHAELETLGEGLEALLLRAAGPRRSQAR